jgi:amino acid transporter
MASRRVLPEFLSRISVRFSTPAMASIVISLIVIAIM